MTDEATNPQTSDPARDPAGAEAASDNSRRRFLQRAGLGGAAVVAGGVAAREVLSRGQAASAAEAGLHPHAADFADGGSMGGSIPGDRIKLYGHGFQPPAHMSDGALDAITIPPPARRASGPTVHEHEFTVTERILPIAEDAAYEAWTYNGTAPGPILRATEGDLLRITLHNRTSHDHNLHLHGRHSPQMDGWEPIPPGESFTYEVTAEPFGLHPYHCHTAPLARHISKGLYGAMIVDPAEGREPAHEFVLILSGWDFDGDGRNEAYTFNGTAGFFTKFPIKVPAGDLVRVYVLNMVEYEPLASFHLHAQTFDVFRSGTSLDPHEHTDTVTMSQGERVIVEFRLPERGRYMFHPHQHHMADAGAMGWFAAI